MVQDTPHTNEIVNTLIQDYDIIFMNKEVEDTLAIALYDYPAQDPSELSFTQGQTIKVLAQDPDGWWEGELDNKIGRFPGSYVQIQVKTKKEKFFEDLAQVKKKLAEEQQQVKSLTESKAALENEILVIQKERQNFEGELKQLREYLLKVVADNKIDKFIPKLEVYSSKMDTQCENLNRLEDNMKALQTDLDSIRSALRNPPPSPDPKKAAKSKTMEKLETEVSNVQTKLSLDEKKRKNNLQHFSDVHEDLTVLRQLAVGIKSNTKLNTPTSSAPSSATTTPQSSPRSTKSGTSSNRGTLNT